MKISVVVSTYNGEKYIIEQLNSLLQQTRKADEVLINDDQSIDNTVGLIRKFIIEHSLLTEWHLTINQEKKGCVKNFLDGAISTTGDIVFYCDQDDIWEPEKLQLMESGFKKYKEMQACYCLKSYIDELGNKIGVKNQFASNVKIRSKDFQKVSVPEVIKYNKSPGLCLAFKKELISELYDFIIFNGLTHDLPVGIVSAIHGGYFVLNQELVKYRQHSSNLSAPRVTLGARMSNKNAQISGREGRLKQMKAVCRYYEGQLSKDNIKNLETAIIETQKSIEFLNENNSMGLFIQIFSRNPMMNRWVALNNFLCSLKRK